MVKELLETAQSKKPVIYQRGDRRVRRVLRLFQQLLVFSGASAFSVCSAVKFKDIAISLKKSTVPLKLEETTLTSRLKKKFCFAFLSRILINQFQKSIFKRHLNT
ncbi:hypothetical protein C5S35_06385 [Candidatus Methanophagaceae archaeon]|nr:hypothetical protein C5S35_06385 [Methanophagales archaeon]